MEGSRVAKGEGGGKLPWIIAGLVIGALAAAYLGLCAWAMSRNTILPNVSVAGIDVSNMTLEQAENAVRTAVEQRGENIKLTLVYEDLEESMYASQLIHPNRTDEADKALSVGRKRFLDSGYQLLGHMLGMSSQVPISLDSSDPALEELIDRMAKAVADATEDHGYQVEGERLVMTKGAPVATVDWNMVKDDALKALREAFEEAGEGGPVEKTVTLTANQSEKAEPDFEAIHREVYTEPKDASLDLDAMEITDHVVGRDFDVEELKAAYRSAKGGETFSIPLTLTLPKVTKEDLGGSLFRDVLGEATTDVAGSATRRNNVKLAAAACNGIILLPGEEFSYNRATGQRTTDKGYGGAPAYVAGATVDEVGGGVCQGSSTIYYAVLHTSLEIVERRPHRYAVTYVPDGMDATVNYGSIDFRFKNNTDYPVKIVTSSYDAGGKRKLNVKIYGTNPDGHYAKPTSGGAFNVVAPTVTYVADSGVARGALVLDREQNAYRGKSVQSYRTIYAADGTQLERQNLGVSTYKMRPSVYHYNPEDGHPSTWVNGVPPTAPSTDPGGTTDPGGGTNPGGTTDPGGGTNPGGTTDPGGGTNPGGTTDPGGATNPGSQTQPSDSGITPIDPNAAA